MRKMKVIQVICLYKFVITLFAMGLLMGCAEGENLDINVFSKKPSESSEKLTVEMLSFLRLMSENKVNSKTKKKVFEKILKIEIKTDHNIEIDSKRKAIVFSEYFYGVDNVFFVGPGST